ncbi:chromo domain-containing protein [Nephila pilipes]|uniref:Chromo domain-containing protein n=1 Tax=Nephila pilipes TaxID=299642 RepID=A0A8X6PTY1_NEPPI|nr:chromo domain-containing protein [Nephila pilipes]
MDNLVRDQKINTNSALENVKKLKKLYYDPKESASFGDVKRLSEASDLKKTRVRKFLSGEDPYTLHFPLHYKFQRQKTIAYGVNELWQSDLVDLQKISHFNRGHRYILTIIDVMSRYLRTYPIKDKRPAQSLKFSAKSLKSIKREIEVVDEKLLSTFDISLYNKDHEHFVAGFNANMKNIFIGPPLVITLSNNNRQINIELKQGFDWIVTPEKGSQLLRMLGLDPHKTLTISHRPGGFTLFRRYRAPVREVFKNQTIQLIAIEPILDETFEIKLKEGDL